MVSHLSHESAGNTVHTFPSFRCIGSRFALQIVSPECVVAPTVSLLTVVSRELALGTRSFEFARGLTKGNSLSSFYRSFLTCIRVKQFFITMDIEKFILASNTTTVYWRYNLFNLKRSLNNKSNLAIMKLSSSQDKYLSNRAKDFLSSFYPIYYSYVCNVWNRHFIMQSSIHWYIIYSSSRIFDIILTNF